MDQTTALVIVLAVALLVVGALVWKAMNRRHSDHLRGRFGPEYDHALHEHGSVSRAEKDLERRSKRVEKLAIRPLPAERRQNFAERWKAQQAQFVDEPRRVVDDADHLVEEVMRERGYPVGEFDQRVADISVDHPNVVDNYRAAHAIAERGRRGPVSTEDLRQAMIYYRDLFLDLLEDRSLPRGATSR